MVYGHRRRPVFYLEHDVSETGLCFLLQVEPTQMGLNRLNFLLD
jgi:hypothetical protein